MAMSRALQVDTLLCRSVSRWVRNAVDTPGASPSSMSAWRTQVRTDSTP
jgi:hypothetical protein